MGSVNPAPAHHPTAPTDTCLACVRGIEHENNGAQSPLGSHDPLAAALGFWAKNREAEYQAQLAEARALLLKRRTDGFARG